MKVRVKMMVQDPLTSQIKGMRPTEGFDIEDEDFFLEGRDTLGRRLRWAFDDRRTQTPRRRLRPTPSRRPGSTEAHSMT